MLYFDLNEIGLRSPSGFAYRGDTVYIQVGKFYGHNLKKYEGKYETITPPLLSLENEIAPGGIEFNSPDNNFDGTQGNLFVAFYGPGERWNRGGVGRVTVSKTDSGYEFEEFPLIFPNYQIWNLHQMVLFMSLNTVSLIIGIMPSRRKPVVSTK